MTRGVGGDRDEASRRTVDIFKRMIKAYAGQLDEPYEFPSYHTAMRDPFDYYQLGNDYVGAMIDWQRSVVRPSASPPRCAALVPEIVRAAATDQHPHRSPPGGKNPPQLRHERRWDTVLKQLAAGENVILLANHQSEADAAFIPLMTASSHPEIGEKVIYVAGDRVTSDLMAKPFSMGRNLLNVHSKKYMDADPALKPAKMRQNLRTLKEMERLLKEGGKLLWIAPSGGRDRRKEGVLSPDRFDPDAVEMMRKMGTKKGMTKTHYYPLAMATYDVRAPPGGPDAMRGAPFPFLSRQRDAMFTDPLSHTVPADDAAAGEGGEQHRRAAPRALHRLRPRSWGGGARRSDLRSATSTAARATSAADSPPSPSPHAD